MARRASCGFELIYAGSGLVMEATNNEDNLLLHNEGRCGGYCFVMDNCTAINYCYEMDIRSANGGSAAPTVNPSYSRFYIKVKEYPVVGDGRGTTIWGISGSSDILVPAGGALSSVYARLMSNGTIEFYSLGNTVTHSLLGTITTPLTLDVWYRVNIYCNYNTVVDPGPPPDDSDAQFIVQIAEAGSALPPAGSPGGQTAQSGSRAFNWGGTVTPMAFGPSGINQIQKMAWPFVGIANRNTGMNRGVICFDDWVIDDAVQPGEGFVTCHRPVAQGTYSEWLTNNFRQAHSLPESQDVDLASNGVSTRVSFQVESFASKGVTGTIKSFKVGGRTNAPRDGWAHGIRKNGVDSYNPALITGTACPLGWQVDRSVLAINPSDTIEIIMRDGTGAGTNAVMDFYCLMVDVEQAAFDPFADAVDDIQVYEGTFVGTGGFQDVAIPFATPAEPDFVLVRPDNTGGAGGWWLRSMGNRGDGGVSGIDSDPGPINWVDTNSFTVRQTEGVNDLGETNRFFAFSDPSRRMTANAASFGRTVTDNKIVPLLDASFLAEAVFATRQAAATDASFYRGPGNVGDLTSKLDGDVVAAADLVQAINTGSLELGATLVPSGTRRGLYGLKTLNVFTANILCVIGSYIGDNAASRVIPITLTGATGAGFVAVVPSNTGQRSCRFGSQVGTGSFRWNDTPLNTTAGITGFTLTGFTVTTGSPNLNAVGVIYNYFVFAGGIDSPPPTSPLVIIVPQPDPDVQLCEDCGCRMAYVPREDRLERIDREIRAKVVAFDPRTEVILLDRRVTTIFPENRELDIECA